MMRDCKLVKNPLGSFELLSTTPINELDAYAKYATGST